MVKAFALLPWQTTAEFWTVWTMPWGHLQTQRPPPCCLLLVLGSPRQQLLAEQDWVSHCTAGDIGGRGNEGGSQAPPLPKRMGRGPGSEPPHPPL